MRDFKVGGNKELRVTVESTDNVGSVCKQTLLLEYLLHLWQIML
jgi:hypothetical protein